MTTLTTAEIAARQRYHRKASIYLGPAIMAAFAAIEDEGSTGFNRSGRLNNIVERYMAMVETAMPSFTVNEWLAIFDANNGIASELPTIACAFANVWDYPYDQLGKKWKIDGEELAKRMQHMPLGSRLAISEVIERYWGGAYRFGDSRKILQRIGANIKEEQDG